MKLFVTGTDTGVGKTFVTTAIARELVRQGESVFAWKPIETGCSEHAGLLVGEDAEMLALAAGNWQTGVGRGLYLFRTPVAPFVASALEGRSIDLAEVVAIAHAASTSSILVEGAGGLRVPITSEVDMGGLAGDCGYPVLVVARASLGTINHSVLTVEAARRDGLTVVGVVLSRLPDVGQQTAESNRSEIARIGHVPVHIFNGSDPLSLVAFLSAALHG